MSWNRAFSTPDSVEFGSRDSSFKNDKIDTVEEKASPHILHTLNIFIMTSLDSFLQTYDHIFCHAPDYSRDMSGDSMLLFLHKQIMPKILDQCTSKSECTFAEKLFLVTIVHSFYGLIDSDQSRSVQGKLRNLIESLTVQCQCATFFQAKLTQSICSPCVS